MHFFSKIKCNCTKGWAMHKISVEEQCNCIINNLLPQTPAYGTSTWNLCKRSQLKSLHYQEFKIEMESYLVLYIRLSNNNLQDTTYISKIILNNIISIMFDEKYFAYFFTPRNRILGNKRHSTAQRTR